MATCDWKLKIVRVDHERTKGVLNGMDLLPTVCYAPINVKLLGGGGLGIGGAFKLS